MNPPGSIGWLTLRCPPLQWAIPVEQVERVLHFVALTPLPGAPPRVRGLLNLHGEALPVISLHEEPGSLTPCPEHRLVCVQGQRRLAIWVEEVGDVFECPPEAWLPLTVDAPGWLGVTSRSQGVMLLRNPGCLLDTQELSQLDAVLAERGGRGA